jgi:thiol-disulfide isomerase/thioredoxin
MHDKFQDKSVIFMEETDFDPSGNFLKPMHGKGMVIMIGATFCPHCTEHGAPVFNEFAVKNRDKNDKDKSKVITGVVYADGESSEQNLARLFGEILGVRAIPLYVFFGPDNKIKSHYVGALKPNELEEFVNKNLS